MGKTIEVGDSTEVPLPFKVTVEERDAEGFNLVFEPQGIFEVLDEIYYWVDDSTTQCLFDPEAMAARLKADKIKRVNKLKQELELAEKELAKLQEEG